MSATEISGKLEGLQLSDLMKMIRVSRRTGKLTLEDQGQHGTIEFLDGRIVRAQASWDYDSLGALLVERGAITEQQLLEAVEAKDEQGLEEPIGRVLIDLGMTTADVVRDSMRRQVDRVVGRLMRIDQGSFEFEPGRESADAITQDVGEVLRELSVTVESAHAPTGSGRATPVKQLRTLKRDLLELREARTKSAVVAALGSVLERHVARLVVFERRRYGLRAVATHGIEVDGIVLEGKAGTIFTEHANRSAYADSGDERFAALHRQIEAPGGGSCLLIGLAGLGRPKRVIYADQGSSSNDLPCLEYIDLLLLEAELLAETANARASKRSRRKNP